MGAILYAALTARPPFQSLTTAETLRRVIEETPVPVRQLQPSVPRDLETICGKCLHKEPARRYASAAALADDLDRWLAGKAILARPAGPAEQAWMWVRRSPKAAGVMAALAAIAGIALWQWCEAVHARATTEVEARNAEGISGFLQDVLGPASPVVQATDHGRVEADLTVRAALDRAVARLDAGDGYRDQPLREQKVRSTAGTIYYRLKKFDQAADQFARAVALGRVHLPAAHPDLLEAINNLGDTYREAGRYADAEPLLREALNGRRAALGDHPLTFQTTNNLALLYGRIEGGRMANPAAAEALFREALAGRRRMCGSDDPQTLRSLHNMGYYHFWQSEYAAAEPYLVEALAGRRRMPGGSAHPETLETLMLLAELYRWWEREPEQAERLFREAAASVGQMLPGSPPAAYARFQLGQFLFERGRFADAESELVAGRAGMRADAGHADELGRAADMLAKIAARKVP